MPLITLLDVFNYIDIGERCFKEGEAVLNAGHVISCGLSDENKKEIKGLCLQTSFLKGSPHTISITLGSGTPNNWICICTCKAGAGGKCKHIVACLLFINRNELEQLSITDMEQAWGQRKSITYTDNVEPLTEFCHVKKKKVTCKATPELLDNVYQELMSGAPSSEAAIHLAQRRKPVVIDKPILKCTKMEVLKQTLKLNLTLNVDSRIQFSVPTLSTAEKNFYDKHIKITLDTALNIAIDTIGQQSALWKSVRQSRITASRCYELHTYFINKNPDWNKKLQSFLNPTFKGNASTKYGLDQEFAAKAAYAKQYGQIYDCGVIIHPRYPFLAFSPDALKKSGNYFYKCVEFKCPVQGSKKGFPELLIDLPYILYDASRIFHYYLNHKHRYYGQVQLGMFILNVDICDFVIFSSYSNDVFVIQVERDDSFLETLLNRLHIIYFKHYLQKLIRNEMLM